MESRRKAVRLLRLFSVMAVSENRLCRFGLPGGQKMRDSRFFVGSLILLIKNLLKFRVEGC